MRESDVMEPRTPPKFVPTLTEVAPQELAVPAADATGDDGQAQQEAPASADAAPHAALAGAADDSIDLANTPTHSGWAEVPSGALPEAIGAVGEPAAPATAWHIDTEADAPAGAAAHAPGTLATTDAARSDMTASLVASAAETAQALEDAITRRVLRHVQDTLDERLTKAVLLVVAQQTALLQSSLELQIEQTIRDAVSDAVGKVLGKPTE